MIERVKINKLFSKVMPTALQNAELFSMVYKIEQQVGLRVNESVCDRIEFSIIDKFS